MLEFWMPFSKIEVTRKLGTWCDGIVLLTVADIHRTAFLLTGVDYFPNDLSPFELEFHFRNRRDFVTTAIRFRFGMLDHNGGLYTCEMHSNVEAILAQRPQNLQDWAVAVELTPPQ